jgi:quinoprotein glucose dehydrogenase
MPSGRAVARIILVCGTLLSQMGAVPAGDVTAAAAPVTAGAEHFSSDWPSYGYDLGGARFSPLTQITRKNVHELEIAWTYHMRPAEVAESNPTYFLPSEATPLVVAGTLYLPTPYGEILALDADTGKKQWGYRLPNRDRPATRGVAYWPGDDTRQPRIVVGTRSGKLLALQASDGKPSPDFGSDGSVDMKTPEVMNDNPQAMLGMSSPPLVFHDLLITGSQVQEFPTQGAAGDVRAWDARTGRLVWTFHTIPRPGEPGHDTWEGESWKNRSGANVWTSPVADSKRGIVYLPIAAPAFDRWGADRKGKNLFANAIAALEAATGKYLWSFQTVHHDLWDLDLPAATLLDVRRGGRTIPAIAVANKAAILFLLDRITGKPIYEVREVPVPTQTDIPGEAPWPTQPLPTAPPPLARQSFVVSDLADLTPQIKARCEQLMQEWNVVESGMFQPPRTGAAVVHFPGGQGGVSWGGSTFVPSRGYYIVNITNLGSPAQLARQANGEWGLAHGYRYFWDRSTRIPCQRPPWGELVAVDVNTGQIAWRTPLGVTDSLPEGLRNTGRPSAGGVMATAAGLIFVGATDDSRLRAFDGSTGELLWEQRLPASVYATPMTYAGKSGRQYVAAVNTGGMTGSDITNDELTVFALSTSALDERHTVSTVAPIAAPSAASVVASGGATPPEPPSGPGLELIRERCTTCHPATQIFTAARRSPLEWSNTVRQMAGRGAALSPEETQAISDYLGANFALPAGEAGRH